MALAAESCGAGVDRRVSYGFARPAFQAPDGRRSLGEEDDDAAAAAAVVVVVGVRFVGSVAPPAAIQRGLDFSVASRYGQSFPSRQKRSGTVEGNWK